jgi:hypothetical protein
MGTAIFYNWFINIELEVVVEVENSYAGLQVEVASDGGGGGGTAASNGTAGTANTGGGGGGGGMALVKMEEQVEKELLYLRMPDAKLFRNNYWFSNCWNRGAGTEQF